MQIPIGGLKLHPKPQIVKQTPKEVVLKSHGKIGKINIFQ